MAQHPLQMRHQLIKLPHSHWDHLLGIFRGWVRGREAFLLSEFVYHHRHGGSHIQRGKRFGHIDPKMRMTQVEMRVGKTAGFRTKDQRAICSGLLTHESSHRLLSVEQRPRE